MSSTEGEKKQGADPLAGFVVRRGVPPEKRNTEEPVVEKNPLPLDPDREPLVPGVPPQTGKPRVVTAELWMLVRACAEGRRLSLEGLSDITGISLESIKSRGQREKWMTPERMRRENIKKVDAVMQPIFDEINEYIKENVAGDGEGGGCVNLSQQGSDEIIDSTEARGMDLRDYCETPAKFRPKDHDLLPSGGGGAVVTFLEKLKQIQFDVKSEMAKRADMHKLLVSEISQQGLAHIAEQVQGDPGLAILLAGNIEKLEKMGRRNHGLDADKDPLGGARTVLVMSDPGMIPKPAITVMEAEMVEEDEDSPEEPIPEPTLDTVDYERELRN